MRELVEYLISKLVDDMTDVTIELIEKGNISDIVVTLPASEMGKVIGKQGRIAKAIRILVKTASSRERKKYNVEIAEKQK